jgi:Tol biopolymer transport system component
MKARYTNFRKSCRLLVLLAALSACQSAVAPTPTEPPTALPSETPLPVTPTAVQSPEPTATPTITPTASLTPEPTVTPTETTTPYPTIDPLPTISFAGDRLTRVTIDKQVVDGIGRVWLSFVNINDRPSVTLPVGTPAPASGLETVFLAAPTGGPAIKVVDLPASTDRRLYWSPNGAYLAYFLGEGGSPGLYLLDLKLGLSMRLFELADLNPRGILSEPVWSPDSTELSIALATAYDVDIYSVSVDGTQFRNMTESGGYDFWPAWSPDGQYLAFVSDRANCPTWAPNEPQSCYRPDLPPPDGGNLYVVEATSGAVRQLSDAWVNSAPHWISSTRLVFTSGKPGDLRAGSTLWWADLRGGPPHRLTDADPAGVLIVRDAWSADGKRVIYQEAESLTHIVARDDAGNEIARILDFNFPRYAFTAAWSPDGRRLVIGGHNSQCPYGMILTDDSFRIVVNAPPNPGVCDPTWSPDGRYIAFAGVTQSGNGTDGRLDVYIAEASGYGARNLTGRSGGQIRLLGWIGKP